MDESLRAEYEELLALCKAAQEEQLAKEWPDEEVLLSIYDDIHWCETVLGLE